MPLSAKINFKGVKGQTDYEEKDSTLAPKPAHLSLATEDSNCIFPNSISNKQPI